MSLPKVSVVTVNFNGSEDTLACLKSLQRCTYPNFEVWVVDNGSAPREREKLGEGLGKVGNQESEGVARVSSLRAETYSSQRSNLRSRSDQDERSVSSCTAYPLPLTTGHSATFHLLPSPTNLGFGGGNNLALRRIIKEGKSKYAYLLNNDTEVDPDFLTHVLNLAESGPSLPTTNDQLPTFPIGIVNSLCVQFDDRTKVENAGHELLDCGDSVYRGRGDSIAKYSSTDYQLQTTNSAPDLLGASGAAVLYRLDTLRACGLFDESFFLNYEDADLSLRAVLYGWRAALEPRSIVYHQVNASIKKVKNYDYFVRSQYNQFRAYFHNVPTLTLLLNLPAIIIHDLGVPLLNLVCMRWIIVKVFVHARLRFFRNLGSIWRVRRENLKHQKTSAWYFLRLQKNFIPTYIRYFREIIVEKRRSVFEENTNKIY